MSALLDTHFRDWNDVDALDQSILMRLKNLSDPGVEAAEQRMLEDKDQLSALRRMLEALRP